MEYYKWRKLGNHKRRKGRNTVIRVGNTKFQPHDKLNFSVLSANGERFLLPLDRTGVLEEVGELETLLVGGLGAARLPVSVRDQGTRARLLISPKSPKNPSSVAAHPVHVVAGTVRTVGSSLTEPIVKSYACQDDLLCNLRAQIHHFSQHAPTLSQNSESIFRHDSRPKSY